MDNRKKLVLYASIVFICLLILVVGASYAYFSVSTSNTFGSKTISSSTPQLGVVTLTSGSNLSLQLTASQMMLANAGDYYASPTGTTTVETENVIATATVTGAGTFNCNYTLEVTKSATNDLYTAFQNWSGKVGDDIVLLVIDSENRFYNDFVTANLFTNNKLTLSGSLKGVSAGKSRNITASFWITNSSYLNQDVLKGKDITLTFSATTFTCSAIEPIYYVYDSGGTNNVSSGTTSNAGLTYYLKGYGSGEYSEACGVYGGQEYCLDYDSWDKVSTYYSELTALGVSCNSTYISDGYLTCFNGTTGVRINGGVVSSGDVNHMCTIYGYYSMCGNS